MTPDEFNGLAARRPFIAKPAPATAAGADEFNPLAVRSVTNDNEPQMGHNNPPPHIVVFQAIDDLFDEARNFADGEPIASEEMHDAITKLYDGIHEAGKRADALRVEEKKPFDDGAKAVQAKWNPYVQKDKGKVDMAKAALGTLLAAWRNKVRIAKEAESARIAAIAAEAEAAARAAMQASAGNLEARVEAEQRVEQAKAWGKAARAADKQATTGLGLRTVTRGTVEDWNSAMDWAYERDPSRFRELVQQMVDEAVRGNVRTIPGVRVWEEKRAA